MIAFAESTVEDAALAWLEALGYSVLHGPEIAADQPGAERSDPNFRDAVLEGRLRQALVGLNPDLPQEALNDAFRSFMRTEAPSLLERMSHPMSSVRLNSNILKVRIGFAIALQCHFVCSRLRYAFPTGIPAGVHINQSGGAPGLCAILLQNDCIIVRILSISYPNSRIAF